MAGGTDPARSSWVATMAGFAAFGAFWGVWGAAIPQIRAQAGLDDTQLGVAVTFIGMGALPTMLVTGKVIDRWGLRKGALTPALMGVAGVVVVLVAHDLVSLAAALALLGMTSGAADVVCNSAAGRAERALGRPVVTRAHGVFSVFVVIGSLGTGLLVGLGAPVLAAFAAVGLVTLAASALMSRSLPGRAAGQASSPDESSAGDGDPAPSRGATLTTLSLVGFGLLGALAFASENAHQSWSAIVLTDALGADVAVGSLAPAVFAAAVAVTRFAAGGIGTGHARVVLAAGSATAALGAVVVAVAPHLAVGLVGLVAAAAGTAVLFPMIVAVVSARVEEHRRGRAISIVSSLSYLGFVLSPAYVGLWSGAVGIRGAMVAVAGVGVALLLLSAFVRQPATSWPGREQVAAGGRRRG